MSRVAVRVVPVIVLVLVVAPLFAQRPGGATFGGGVGALLTNKSVLDELKVTDDQKERLKSVGNEMREKFGKDLQAARKDQNRDKVEQLAKQMRTETNQAVEKVLKPDQFKRLQQLELQVAAQTGNLDPLTQSERVRKALNLSDKQLAMIKDTSETLGKERREALQGGQFDREKMQAIQKKSQASAEKIFDSFSADQKTAWKGLTGEKFTFVPQPFRQKQ